MFHSARIKLTGWYLLIIMIVSIIFSLTIYRGLVFEIERGLRMQSLRNITRDRLEKHLPPLSPETVFENLKTEDKAIFGVIGSYAIAKVMSLAFIISPSSIVLAFVVSAGIGIIFGWYPAKRASDLQPIEALRYE